MTNTVKPKSLIYIAMHRKFSIIKILICLYIEKIHRKVYDNQYRQDYKLTWKDIPIMKWYSFLFWLIPDFRAYLEHWKPILKKAYNIKRLSIIRQVTFWNIRKVNVERYSSYCG
jgi:hypothetical protein